VRTVVVRVRQLPIPAEFCAGDYEGDAAFRGGFHRWLAQLWDDKDRQIDALVTGRATAIQRTPAAAPGA